MATYSKIRAWPHLSLQIPYQVGPDVDTQRMNDDTVCPAEK